MTKSNAFPGLLLPVLFILGFLPSAFGQIITQPAGLTFGEQYQLVFVTDGTTEATSTSISTYNAFALAQANTAPALVALGTSWSAIASTSTVSAISNTGTSGTGVPIYGLDGSLVAANYSTLWTGTWTNGIDISESGVNFFGEDVWTGSHTNGTGWVGFELGGTSGDGIVGFAGATASGAGIYSTAIAETSPHPEYVISAVLTATPEPGSATLLVVGAGALLGWRRRIG